MNRRLPAEVVTRRRPTVKKPEEKFQDEVQVDLKTALTLKPENRLKWLGKAFKMTEEGRALSNDLYDIVSSRKFVAGAHAKVCRRIRAVVLENLDIFSDKQQRFFKSDEWACNTIIAEMDDRDQDRDVDPKKDIDDFPDRPSLRVHSQPPSSPVSTAPPSTSSPAPASTAASSPTPAPHHAPQHAPQHASRAAAAAFMAAPAKERAPPSRPTVAERFKEPTAGVWMEAEDSAARSRARALEQARRDTAQSKERARRDVLAHEMLERSKEAEVEENRRKTIESQADSSLMFLERLEQQQQERTKSRSRSRRRSRSRKKSRERKRSRSRRKHRGASRSISIQAERSSHSRSKKRKKKKEKSIDFEEALRRRMQQRESEVDSSRIPVVDPGHAKRNWGGRCD